VLLSGGYSRVEGDDPLAAATRALASGAIVAVKGVGGFALAVDATNEEAVARLRARKRRPHKPLAVMVRDLDTLAAIAWTSEIERRELASPARPIVLVTKRRDSPLAPSVAPSLAEVGAFLPPTALQHLLLAEGPALQVMTSGNLAGEPLATSNADAIDRLQRVADLLLVHDRDIHSGADDSVVRVVGGAPLILRRARGYVPDSIRLPVSGPPVLGLGGELKATICLAAGGNAILSPHIGDLRHPAADELFASWIERLSAFAGVRPQAVAHDLHPDFRSTRWAEDSRLSHLPVQHHHAHIAACLAEHGRTERVLGVAFDGAGYGPDNTLWGGEFLEADLAGFRRLGHLGTLRLPGGERAILQPWRLAVAALVQIGEDLDVLGRSPVELRRTRELFDRGFAMPTTSSAGRWFDVAAALAGFRDRATYDGQAAIELEALASDELLAPYELALSEARNAPFVVDLRSVVRAMAADARRGVPPGVMSARFHETMAMAIRQGCRRARADGAPPTIVLSGGCFQNRRLAERARHLLESDGFEVLTHRQVPPNDGGLSFGQAAILSFRLSSGL
jgi:hydrogenase maturation protein HypF